MKKGRKLTKFQKIEVKNKIFIENIYFLLEDKSIKGLLILKNNILCYKNLDWKEDMDSKNNIKITNNDDDVLDIYAFIKLLKTI